MKIMLIQLHHGPVDACSVLIVTYAELKFIEAEAALATILQEHTLLTCRYKRKYG